MSPSAPSLRREPYFDASDDATEAAYARRLLSLLIAQDGSATRLCEALAGGPVSLKLLHQAPTEDVPRSVRELLPGTRFIERVTCLAAHGQVMMDNLSYIALEGIDTPLREELEAGQTPIGHLLARLWIHREALDDAMALHDRLWRTVGLPDPHAARAYRVFTPEGPRMVIAETFRRGMRKVQE
jgi:chorismate-pyruvate lyase